MKFLRKPVGGGAPLQVTLILKAHQHFGVQPAFQLPEFVGESLSRGTRHEVVAGCVKTYAPDALSRFRIQFTEKLHESRQQIRLGHQQVDRESNTQALIEFGHPRAHVPCVALALILAPEHQVRHAERHQCPV